MTTRADLTRQTARLITRTVIGTTTSAPGNGTQIVDTVNLANFPDDQFNGGTAWITSGLNAGLSRPVTDFEATPDRLTVSAFPNNIASGVTFEVVDDSMVTFQDLNQAVNLALREIGRIWAKDDTLTIVDDQLVYDLPAGVTMVQRVEILEDPTEDDEKHKVSNHWDEVEGDLVFQQYKEPSTMDGTKLRIWYKKFHTELTTDTDALSDQIDEEYLVYLAARQAMRLAYKRAGKAGSETIPEWLNESIEELKKHIRPNKYAGSVRIRTSG